MQLFVVGKLSRTKWGVERRAMREGTSTDATITLSRNLSSFKSLTSIITGHCDSKLQGFPTLASTYIQCQNFGIHHKKWTYAQIPFLLNRTYGTTGRRCDNHWEVRCMMYSIEVTMLLKSIWRGEGLQLEDCVHGLGQTRPKWEHPQHHRDLCVCVCTDESRARKCVCVWFWAVSRHIVGQMAGGSSISFP